MDGQKNQQRDRETDGWTDRLIAKRTDRQTEEGLMEGRTDRHT